MSCRGVLPTITAGLIALSVWSGTAANTPAGGPQPRVQRLLWGGTVMSSNDWDWAASAGFTIVQSYGSDWNFLRQMLDEAQKRGMKMIACPSGFPQAVPWLTLQVDKSAGDAPTDLWPHVVQHFSMAAPKLLLYGGGMTGLAEGIEIPLNDSTNRTLKELAATLNALGHGIRATVLPGKGSMAATNLAADWYGDALQGPVTLDGGEVNEDMLQRYVDTVKDHPALFCFAPFDDPDLQHFSPSFQRYIRGRLREWAPQVPAYLLVSSQAVSPGIGGHDGRIAPDAYEGVVTYIYPSDWDNAGVFLDVDSIRTGLQDWWSLHSRIGPKEIIFLDSAFSWNAGQPPPSGAQDLQWRSALASGVPLTGFGYYTWSGETVTVANTPRLQAEVAALDHSIATNYGELVLGAQPQCLAINAGKVDFQESWRGETPANFYWDFGDGGVGWGTESATSSPIQATTRSRLPPWQTMAFSRSDAPKCMCWESCPRLRVTASRMGRLRGLCHKMVYGKSPMALMAKPLPGCKTPGHTWIHMLAVNIESKRIFALWAIGSLPG